MARRALYAQFLDDAKATEASTREDSTASALPLLDALNSLSASERMCVVMRFYEGLSAVAIGRDIGVLATTVRKYLTSALDTLAEILGDPHLHGDDALYGGGTLASEGGLPQQIPATDAVTAAFTAVDERAMAAYRNLSLATDSTPVVQAVMRRRRRQVRTVSLLGVGAIASLALGSWTIVHAVVSPVEALAVSSSPSVAVGPYGPGVLSSSDIAEQSQSWTASEGDSENEQRFLRCTVDESPRVPSPSPTASGIQVSSDSDETVNRHDFGDQIVTLVKGDCTQRVTDAAHLTSTIIPLETSAGRNHLSVAVTVKNSGDDPIALYRDSLSVGFELPWGALSSLQGPGQTQFSVQGPSLEDRSLGFFSIPMEDVVVLQPAEQLTVVLSAERWRVSDLQELIDDPASGVTQEMVEEWIRNSSSVGEVTDDDGIMDAFREGSFAPRGAVFLAVAPTEPDLWEVVILMDVHAGFGEMPSSSRVANPSASTSPSASS
jgi:hypothetical protein